METPAQKEQEGSALSDEAKPDIPYNNNIVWILGAGFSADAGMPLINGFYDKIRDCRDWIDWRTGSDWLHKYYQHSKKSLECLIKQKNSLQSSGYRVNIDLENIEELLSLTSASNSFDETEARKAIALTLLYSERVALTHDIRVADLSPVKEITSLVGRSPIKRHDAYLALMSGCLNNTPGRRSIITFNYDMIAERSLARLGCSYHYGFKPSEVTIDDTQRPEDDLFPEDFPAKTPCITPEGMPIYKMHGSLNWIHHREGIEIRKSPYDIIYYRYPRDYDPVIIAPSWRKNWPDAMESVWDGALEEIRKATYIVIIGFSIPPTDTHFKYLMAAGLRGNVSLRKIVFVNPAVDLLKDRIQDIFTPTVMKNGTLKQENFNTLDFFNEHNSPYAGTLFWKRLNIRSERNNQKTKISDKIEWVPSG